MKQVAHLFKPGVAIFSGVQQVSFSLDSHKPVSDLISTVWRL